MGWSFDRHLFTRRKVVFLSAAAGIVAASLIQPGVWSVSLSACDDALLMVLA